MAGRSEAEMWTAFRELDRKIRSLSELRGYLVVQEGVANAAADRVDHRVYSLGRQFDRLMDDRTEAEAWLTDIVRGGVSSLRDTERADNARRILQLINREVLAICERARALDDRRWLFRFSEHYCESGQYSLEETIERLQSDLEKIMSQTMRRCSGPPSGSRPRSAHIR